jgi:uncharacterized protein YbaR (Trm112 family)
MAISASFLVNLRCPKSHAPLRLASADEASALASKWNQTNNPMPPTGFLISTDGAWAYPERDGVPCLLIDEAIAL